MNDPTGAPPHRTASDSETHSDTKAEQTSPVWSVVTGLVLAALLSAGAWSSYWADHRNDQYQLIHIGQLVHDGGLMYLDGWENKPPGIAWLNALGVFISGGSPFGAWVLPAIFGLGGLVVLGATMRLVLGRSVACVMSILGGIVLSIRLYDAASINPDFYSAVFDLVACSLWIVAVNGTRYGRMVGVGYLAGVAWGAAVVTKQTGAIGPLVLTVITLMLSVLRIPGYKRWLLTCVSGWAGMLLIGLGTFWVLRTQGADAAAWDAIFTFNRSIVSFDSIRGLANAWPAVWAALAPVQLVLWLGGIGLLATWRVGKEHQPSPASVTALGIWWFGQVVAAWHGPSGSMRYWMATFPPLIWLAGMGLHHIRLAYLSLGKANRTAFAIVFLTAFLLLGGPLFDHYRSGLASSNVAYAQDPSPRKAYEMLGREVQDVVPAEERIYVWDYDAGIYVHSDRRAASRFTYPRNHDQMVEILDDLAAGNANTILIPKNGSVWFDPLCDELCKSRLTELLGDYSEKEPIGRYAVWSRKD